MKTIIERLRDYGECHDGDIDEAADMLEFFFGQLQMQNLDMGGQHSYRFRSGGWPMTHCKGPSAEQAVVAAIAEVKRSKIEGQQEDEGKSVGEELVDRLKRFTDGLETEPR